MMSILYCLFLLSNAITCLALKDLPAGLPKCNRDVSLQERKDCFLKTTETMKPFLINGIKELHLESISPFIISEISLVIGDGPNSFKTVVKDIKINGFENYRFKHLDFDPNSLSFDASVLIPEIFLKAIYHATGSLVNIPIDGKGDFSANMTNILTDAIVKCKIIEQKGEKYLKTDDVQVKLEFGENKDVKVEGLFTDNDVLAKATQTAIKENRDEFLKEMQPAIAKVVKQILEAKIFPAFLQVPYENLIPVSHS